MDWFIFHLETKHCECAKRKGNDENMEFRKTNDAYTHHHWHHYGNDDDVNNEPYGSSSLVIIIIELSSSYLSIVIRYISKDSFRKLSFHFKFYSRKAPFLRFEKINSI